MAEGERPVRIALISDIHGNLEALEAVLADVSRFACDQVHCLGDLVGYGADPEICIERVREIASHCLLGNHDAVAAGIDVDDGFNLVAREAIRWTRDALSEASLVYLKNLPYRYETEDLLFAHAHPFVLKAWPYVLPGDTLGSIFGESTQRCIAVGHTHVPGVGNENRSFFVPVVEGTLEMAAGGRYLFNPGSVGQPRDGNPRASWGLLDRAASTFELRRVPYDVARAREKILAAGLPGFLAERLTGGV